MAELFEVVFQPQSIYDMLFFNVKSVLKYPTLNELEENEPELFREWETLSKSRFKIDEANQLNYEENAPYYAEYSRIIAITYATLYIEEGKLKRYMKRIVNEDEFTVLLTFMDELWQISTDGTNSRPKHFPTLCGHDIISQDIPHLLKKFIYYRNKFDNDKYIPYILKNGLSYKPWESGIIDTVNVWKFNGFNSLPLSMISEFLGLKKTVELLPIQEVSREYWKLAENDIEGALEFISLQSATQTNLAIQLMNEMRQL